MANAEKLLVKAEKLLLRQKFDDAFNAYLEVYKLEPQDEGVLLNLSDLALKLNRTADALRFGGELTDCYLRRKDSSRAIAICRKLLKNAPQDLATLSKLAPLLEKTQKNNEALETYREVLAVHLKAGATTKSIECLEHIVQMDPNDFAANVQLAEMASQSGQAKVACSAYLRAAQLARKDGQEDRWAEFVERAHGINPNDEEGSIAAAELFLAKNKAPDAITLLEPIAPKRARDFAVLELLTRAYLKTGEWGKAEPLCLNLYRTRSEAIALVEQVIEGYLQDSNSPKAMALVNQLQTELTQQGKGKEFLHLVEKVYKFDETNVEIVELLTVLYNEMNREEGLRRSLARLFNLYLAAEQYDRAADTLERIVDVDPYGAGHMDRLLNMEGHIDPIWYRNIGVRIQLPSAGLGITKEVKSPGPDSATGARSDSLENLLIEGEMYHQYQLSSKLMEILEKIDRLYPGAQQRSPRLQELYDSTGFRPTPAANPPATSAAAESSSTGAPPSPQSLDHLRKISAITANIYRESTLQGVMQVAVDQIGQALNASRCRAALGTADRPPATTAEFCNLGIQASESPLAAKVFSFLMRQAENQQEGWHYENVSNAPDLNPIFPDLSKLGVQSLLALPLMDRDKPAGLILVEQCNALRSWTAGEVILLKAVAPQIVIGVNNSKLRRLVRSLAGTDPETGLLPRGAYLDCLLAEAQRAKEQSQPLSVCLFEPENAASLVKALADPKVHTYFQQVSKAISAHLRQNDIAIRYNPCAIAVVFPDTGLSQAGLAVEKLRRIVSQIRLDDQSPPDFCSVACDIPLGTGFDPVDGVTEVVNRLDACLEEAHKNAGQPVLLSRFEG